jgi:hypothetical protein
MERVLGVALYGGGAATEVGGIGNRRKRKDAKNAKDAQRM